jgi:copper resistance protein D
MQDMSLLQFVLQSTEGHAAALRILGLALVVCLGAGHPIGVIAALLGSLLVAVSFVVTGHSTELGLIARLLVAVHLLGVSFWIGAFYPLRSVTRASDLRRIAKIMKRFGDIAMFAVGALVLSGALLLWIVLGTPLALLESDYGRLLAIKLFMVIALLSLAAANKLILTPALLADNESASARLRISIDAELAVALLILTLTSVLTTVSGPPALR